MSVVRCDCGRHVDSDYDAECFMDDDTIKCHVCREKLLDEPETDEGELK